ncbi:MAG: hypothetical protein AAF787_03580 [Chloroflexota bacterium]
MTLPPSRQSAFETAPMPDLLDILLRQFKRPLANYSIDLKSEDVDAISAAAAAKEPPSAHAVEVREGLVKAVAESEAVLAGWELTFAQSLRTEMADMPGWETTAEFLDLANEKSNAELRIAAGSALVLALGDERYRHHLTFLIENPALDDVSAIMAKRVVDFVDV